mmetsp:Transcript_14106/g.40642  ORF Transcript_14106/g.40642 Transcript_14106/m.40642 type:complete len:309 (+) Transcript_14106:528-1454(+)
MVSSRGLRDQARQGGACRGDAPPEGGGDLVPLVQLAQGLQSPAGVSRPLCDAVPRAHDHDLIDGALADRHRLRGDPILLVQHARAIHSLHADLPNPSDGGARLVLPGARVCGPDTQRDGGQRPQQHEPCAGRDGGGGPHDLLLLPARRLAEGARAGEAGHGRRRHAHRQRDRVDVLLQRQRGGGTLQALEVVRAHDDLARMLLENDPVRVVLRALLCSLLQAIGGLPVGGGGLTGVGGAEAVGAHRLVLNAGRLDRDLQAPRRVLHDDEAEGLPALHGIHSDHRESQGRRGGAGHRGCLRRQAQLTKG